jgi:hypothetical protein
VRSYIDIDIAARQAKTANIIITIMLMLINTIVFSQILPHDRTGAISFIFPA